MVGDTSVNRTGYAGHICSRSRLAFRHKVTVFFGIDTIEVKLLFYCRIGKMKNIWGKSQHCSVEKSGSDLKVRVASNRVSHKKSIEW